MDGAVLAEDAGADVEPDVEPDDGGELDGADEDVDGDEDVGGVVGDVEVDVLGDVGVVGGVYEDDGAVGGADVLAYDEGLAGVDVPAEADGEADTPEGPWL